LSSGKEKAVMSVAPVDTVTVSPVAVAVDTVAISQKEARRRSFSCSIIF